MFLNRLTISLDKGTKVIMWKDDEKLTTSLYPFTEEEES